MTAWADGEPWTDSDGRMHPGAPLERRHGEYGAAHHRPYAPGDDRPLDGAEALALIRAYAESLGVDLGGVGHEPGWPA